MRYRPGNRLQYVEMRPHAVGEVEEKMAGVIFQVVFDPIRASLRDAVDSDVFWNWR